MYFEVLSVDRKKKNDIVAFPPVFLNRIILKVNYFE